MSQKQSYKCSYWKEVLAELGCLQSMKSINIKVDIMQKSVPQSIGYNRLFKQIKQGAKIIH